jgi:UDP-N-acetylmuramoylalanine-D-glutamate ligase
VSGRALVLGRGVSGEAAVRLLERQGKEVVVLDGDDPFDIGTLAESFTLDEISRITKMQVSRASLSKNDASVLSDHIRTLKAEAPRTVSATDDLADIQDLLNRKKK